MSEFSTTGDGLRVPEPTNERLALEARAEALGLDPWFLEKSNIADVCQYVWRHDSDDGGMERKELYDTIDRMKVVGDIAITYYGRILSPDVPSSLQLSIFDGLTQADIELIKVIQAQEVSERSEKQAGTRRARLHRKIAGVAGALGGGFGGALMPMANMASVGAGVMVGAGLMGASLEVVNRLSNKDDAQRIEQAAPYVDQLTSRLKGMLAHKVTIPSGSIAIDLHDKALKGKSYKEFKELIKAERRHLKELREPTAEGYDTPWEALQMLIAHDRNSWDDLGDTSRLVVRPTEETKALLENLADITDQYGNTVSLAGLWHSGLKQVITTLAETVGELHRYRARYAQASRIDDAGGRPKEHKTTRAQYEQGLQVRQTAANRATFAFLQYQQELIVHLQNGSLNDRREPEQPQQWTNLPN